MKEVARLAVKKVPVKPVVEQVTAVIREQTLLPLAMSLEELGGVFAITMAMSVASALLSLGRLRRADPAEVF